MTSDRKLLSKEELALNRVKFGYVPVLKGKVNEDGNYEFWVENGVEEDE